MDHLQRTRHERMHATHRNARHPLSPSHLWSPFATNPHPPYDSSEAAAASWQGVILPFPAPRNVVVCEILRRAFAALTDSPCKEFEDTAARRMHALLAACAEARPRDFLAVRTPATPAPPRRPHPDFCMIRRASVTSLSDARLRDMKHGHAILLIFVAW